MIVSDILNLNHALSNEQFGFNFINKIECALNNEMHIGGISSGQLHIVPSSVIKQHCLQYSVTRTPWSRRCLVTCKP
jgi:hypothetical protein